MTTALAESTEQADLSYASHRNNRLSRVSAIARNAFREAVRDRVLYNLVLFVLLLTGCAIFVGELSAAQETKIIIDLGLSACLLFGAFIAIFTGTGLVYKEIERRTIYAIFSKPVGRTEFLIGKYLGLCLTLAVNVAVMGVGIMLALLYVRGGFDRFSWVIWPTIALIFFELAVLVAVALLFSSFSSPALSALMSFAVFIIGHFSSDLKTFADALQSVAARIIFCPLYYALPNFAMFSPVTSTGHGEMIAPVDFLIALLYAALYATVIITATALIFNRRNFK